VNTDDDFIKEFLSSPKRIAIVGASSNPKRASNEIMKFLMDRGHTIYPIHPMEQSILGITPTRFLKDLNEVVDGVIIYLSKRNVLSQIEIAVNKSIPLVWLPLGITSEEGGRIVQSAGLKYIENRCPKIEYKRLELDNKNN